MTESRLSPAVLITVVLMVVAVLALSVVLARAQDNADALRKTALDTSIEYTERLTALSSLRRVERGAYLATLSDLVESGEKGFAEHAAESLVNLVVMVGSHTSMDMTPGDDSPRHDMGFVAEVHDILRRNVVSKYPRVRQIAASYLAMRGDDKALERIRAAAVTGDVPDSEALSYFTAAPAEVGNTELRHYAENGNDELAQQAIQVLSSDSTQQLYVRENFLTNQSVSEVRRVAALSGLAKYDQAFPSYATQPDVVEFALDVEQVPGQENVSGSDLIAASVGREIAKNPNLREFYTRQFKETSVELQNSPDEWKAQAVERQILQRLQEM